MKSLKTKSLSYLVIGIALVSGMSAKSYATGSISGTVTNSSSGYVVGAKVFAVLDAVGVDLDTTGITGQYSITGLVAATNYEVRVKADGYELRVMTNVVVHNTNNTVNITNLAVEGMITGKVTESDGTTPIPAVLIIANDGSGLIRTGTTNSNGGYTINKLPAATYTVSAIHSGYKFGINEDNVVISGSTTSDVDLIRVVPPSAILSGTVTLSGGTAGIENVTVLANDDTDPDYVRSAITNANGEYTIDKLPAGTYTISAFLSGYKFDTNEDNVVTQGSTTSDVDLTGAILPTGKISGKVTLADGTTPIGNASVCGVASSDSSIVTASVTDSSGDYELTGLGTDTYTVTAIKTNGIIEIANDVSVTNGSTTTLNMSTTEGAISGTVTDSSQTAIEGATLTIIANNRVYRATSDASGDYIVENLPGGDYTLRVNPNNNDYVPGKIEDITVVEDQETSDQDFSLASAGKISGTVKNSSNVPIEGAVAVATGPSSVSNASVITAADGTYTIGGLPSGTYQVAIQADTYVSDSETGVGVTAGQTTSGKDFSLGTSGGAISGKVFKSDGTTPISGAMVACGCPGKSMAIAVTDEAGYYSLALLQAGTYKVRAFAGGYESEELAEVVVTVPNENSNNDFLLAEQE